MKNHKPFGGKSESVQNSWKKCMKGFIFSKVTFYWPATLLKYELPNKYFT